MRIIHLSDLHFGTETPEIFSRLQEVITTLHADLVVISGDFTQVAIDKEFEAAQKFIQSLTPPTLCVPGNHDVPRYDLIERFLDPFKKYKRYIDENLFPFYSQGDVIVAGLNSARSAVPHWNWANGAISQDQIDHLETIFKNSPAQRRICVFHHPIHKALNDSMETHVFGGKNALNILNELKVELVLTGHVHHASITTLGDINHRTIYLSASTALSSRLRTQANGFNLIDIDQDFLRIEIFTYKDGLFTSSENYAHEFQK